MTYTLSQLLEKTEYSLCGGSSSNIDELSIDSVCRDSRIAHKGSVFVCIKGANFDGHDFAESAYMNGCRAFVSEKKLTLADDAIQVIVDDSRVALALISAKFFGEPSNELGLIGITGTKGKTTTALTAYNLLNSMGIKAGYIGSNGVEFDGRFFPTVNTTPESYELHRYMRLMVDCGVRYLIMEVSSQAIYMSRIHGLCFHTVVYTNLSIDHIGESEHPTFEHYRDSKKRLFTEFHAKHIIYNADDEYARYMVEDSTSQKISCSANGHAEFRAINIEKTKEDASVGISFSLTDNEKYFPTRVRMPGRFSVYNALLAAAICSVVGADMSKVAHLLPSVSIKGRFESVDILHYAAFIIDYAHNGVSLTSALTALREYTKGRLICLFGSVGGRTKGRRRELGDAAAELADLSILTSDNPDFEAPEDVISDIEESFINRGKLRGKDYISIPDRREAIRYAVREAKRGDIILLAGKGHEDYQLIKGAKLPFSERAILTEAAMEIGELV